MLQRIGKFEIKQVLGRGAMGEVYLGIDPSIGREIAIKTIHPGAAQGEEAKQRFAREAKAAGILNHPNLVTIYEFGEDQGLLYIAMEYIPGHDLEEFLRNQSLSRFEVLEVLAQVCDGLAFAHSKGIVHRDIKPSNVRIIRDGKRLVAKVTDFGVARISNSDMTATGMVMGTVSYMAPEYIRTGKPDSRSDLFAVGVMLYEALSGRKPFAGDTTPTILYKIVNEMPDPIDLAQLQGISPAVRSILDRALVKDPSQRFQHAEDFARSLRAAKDPTWAGQVVEATTLMPSGVPPPLDAQGMASPPTQVVSSGAGLAPPMPVPGVSLEPYSAGPVQARPRSSSSGRPVLIMVGAAALLLLLAVAGVGGWLLYGKRLKPVPTETGPETASLVQLPPSGPPPAEPPPAGSASSGPPSFPPPPPSHAPNSARDAAFKPPAGLPPGPARPGRPGGEAPGIFPPPRVEKPVAQPADERFHPDALRSLGVSERKNLSLTTMSEAIAMADSNPGKALEGLRNAMAADPSNPRPYAWAVAILYENGRYREIPGVIAKARQNGISRNQMRSNLRFRMAMEKERLERQIPGGLGPDDN